jgi:beta-phosphoglucomutase-like phosphatase (HAD superfamily)
MRHGPTFAIGRDLPVTIWICDVNGVLVDSTALVCQAFLATARRYGFAFTEPDRRRVKGLWLLEAYRGARSISAICGIA